MKSENSNTQSVFLYCPKCSARALRPHETKGYRCDVCGFEFYLNVAASVAAFILDSSNRLLVAVRAKDPAKGTLDLPGGFVDPSETAEEAVVREIREELNLDITEMVYLFSLPNQYPYMGVTYHTLDFAYLCQVDDFSSIKAMDDVKEFQFVPVEQLDPNQIGLTSIRNMVLLFQQQYKSHWEK